MQEIALKNAGKTVRPFLVISGVTPRICSMPLQRRITDFSADSAFHQVPFKLKEHYGITVAAEVIRQITLDHASQITDCISKGKAPLESAKAKVLIAEADGGMIPIVEFDENSSAEDKRKKRKVLWKEARLCFSRDSKKVSGIFRATLKSTETLGNIWFLSALEAGLDKNTKVHCLGDGALWIKNEMERVFGTQAKYLVDFYHVSEYLAGASIECDKESANEWRKKRQEELREGNLYLVLQELERHVETKPKGSATEACYKYLTNRLYELDYLGAILESLPIGSGEIESGHRHVVQKRMKKAGSWWKIENAENMLQLLTLRANGHWEWYWSRQKKGFLEEAA